MYLAKAREHLQFESSSDLAPAFQADVDQLRRRSPCFWLAMVLSTVGLRLVWMVSVMVLGLPASYIFLMGTLLLRQAAMHMRHARNVVLLRVMRDTSDFSGRRPVRGPWSTGCRPPSLALLASCS